MAQDLRLVAQESSAEVDNPIGNRVEIPDLLAPELVQHLSKTQHESRLLLASEVVWFTELDKDLVICQGKRGSQRREGREAFWS